MAHLLRMASGCKWPDERRDCRLSLRGVSAMPRPTIHPGEILMEELAELGVTPTELSRQINVPPNRVTQIIHGRRSVTGDTALRLGHWFGTSAQFWLNLQSAYDIRVAEERAGREIAELPTRPTDPAVSPRKQQPTPL